jgi:hypothetical protein
VIVVEPGSIATRFGDNVVDHRQGPGPYAPLHEEWERAFAKLSGGEPAPGPELVATVICDELESTAPRLRVPVGVDAELVTAARRGTTYEEFEAAMRAALEVTW